MTTGQTGRQPNRDQMGVPDSAHVLTTKLFIPPARTNAIARPHLVDRLLAGLEHPGKFALVCGPAGFGKTTLLGDFAAQCQEYVAWVSLDEGDNDPIRFWTYFISACQTIVENIGESLLALFDTAQQLPDDTIPTLLINEFAAQERSVALVLDDYHVIQNPSVHASVQFLLDHLPPNLHLLVSTRIDPPWPLVRYRARNQLVEIRAQDLRFSVEEAGEFLNHTMALNLPGEDVAALEERTEGWIAGLQLAALSLEGRSDASAFIRDFTGSHVYIAEYLIEEILQKQPEDMQRFLLQTSFLERMNGGLCEAVTGCDDGQVMLTALHRANSFVIPLDNERQWFRYHHLFADLLQARLRQNLSATAIAGLHLRAADWYEQQGFVSEAIYYTLAAGDYGKAASLIDKAGQTMFFTDQYRMLKDWLDALPAESFDTHPRLEIYRVLIELNLGTLDMYEQTLLEKERLVKSLSPSPENDQLRLEAMVYLSLFMAHQNTHRAIRIAHEALHEIPEGNLKLRAFLYSALYRAHGMDGDIERSAPAYRECLRLAQAAGQYGMISNTTMVRAFDLCQYARLDEAASYCQVILDAGAQLNRKVFYPAGTAYIGLGGIHLERNELEAAEDYLTRGLELCRQGGTYGLYTGYLQVARLHQAKGELEKALEVLQKLEQTLQRRDFTLTARQVSIRLATNDLEGASRLEAPLLEILGGSHYSQQLPLIAAEAFKLCLARIFIARGEIARATQILDEIQTTVEPGQRFGRLMEVHLLRALALHKQRAGCIAPDSVDHLERALELAEPPGFVLLLLEEGPALIPLLNAVLGRQAAPDRIRQYARKLLNAFAKSGDSEASRLSSAAAELIEPLTPREKDVLQFIAIGDSNQTIAAKLFVTVRTVKKHTTNIFAKLGVSNRTQAAARARELGLITPD